MDTVQNLKLAKRGPTISIIAYLLLSISKLTTGYLLDSAALVADGFNNFSDIVGNIALLIGLHLASKPADEDHKFGHWKIEDLSSLITSLIMFLVGIQVLIQTVQKIILNQNTAVDLIGSIVGIISAIIMFCVYAYNKQLSKKVKSSALMAAAKDNFSDAITSLGTAVAIFTSSLHFPIIDKLAAIVITYFILKTAYDVFKESAFSLSDGFDEKELKKYEAAILKIPKISKVKSQRGRTYGSNIYLDIVLEMNPDLSVFESHAITEQVEQLLSEQYAIYDVDIHVEPAAIPEDEILDNVYKKLYRNEKVILSKIPGYEKYLAKDFHMIDENGQNHSMLDQSIFDKYYQCNFKYFKIQSISQKTKLVTYELGKQKHTSVWRRHESWYLVYHQITPKTESRHSHYKLIKK